MQRIVIVGAGQAAGWAVSTLRQHASYLLAYDEIRNYLTDIRVPCVVIAGDQDQITPAQGIQDLAAEMQLSRCHLITDAGHLSYVDQPQQFNDIILSAR